MATISTAQIRDFTQKTITAIFGMQNAQLPPEYPQMWDADPMTRDVEEEAEFVGTGYAGFIPEGQSMNYSELGEGYKARWRAEMYGLGIKVSERAILANLFFDTVRKGGYHLENSLRQTKEAVHADWFNSNRNTGDGVTFLNTAHPTKSGINQANTLAVQAQISESAIENMLILIRKNRDAANLYQKLMPVKIMTTPEQEFNLYRILKSVNRSGTTDNDINAIRAKNIFNTDPVISTWLTNPLYWGIKTDCPDGLKSRQWKGLQTSTTVHEDTFTTSASVREYYAVGPGNWRGFFGCNP